MSISPAAVSQRLCDLLLRFPAAAHGGVQWRILARKYEERYSASLDLSRLGLPSPLAATTTLLWDVLRIVDGSSEQNPIVAVEDAVALTPRPNFMGSWPSFYHTLCTIVSESGTLEPTTSAHDAVEVRSHTLLLSKLKPLLQTHWHPEFDDTNFAYLNEDGSVGKLKKLKHLVSAVLRWREQRVEWRKMRGGKASEVDVALATKLEFVPAKGHNDLVLRIVVHRASLFGEVSSSECLADAEASRDTGTIVCDNNAVCGEVATTPAVLSEGLPLEEAFLPEVFDDPFEPPPQKDVWGHHAYCYSGSCTPLGSTAPQSGATTPCLSRMSSACFSSSQSGSATPSAPGPAGIGEQVCAMMPLWFPMQVPTSLMIDDRCVIPSGIVDRLRAQFESPSNLAVVPSMPYMPYFKR